MEGGRKEGRKVERMKGKMSGRLWFVLFFLINLFTYLFWLLWVFIVAPGLSLVTASRSYSSLQCMVFSLQWLLLLRSMGSRREGFSSCGTRAQ